MTRTQVWNLFFYQEKRIKNLIIWIRLLIIFYLSKWWTMLLEIKDLSMRIKRCTKCRLSETRINAICGEGNPDAKLMLIAQAPGIEEDKGGRMFIGPSGKVLDKLLGQSQIDRGKLYMTNLVKCIFPSYRKPKQDEIERCSSYLDSEIKLIDPTIIVPLGHYSTKYVFNKYGLSLPSKQEFYTVYGKLFLAHDQKILPLQHPAAVLHNPSLKDVMVTNYRKLHVLSTECKWYRVCPLKLFYEGGLLESTWIELYCKGDWERCVRYHLEKKDESYPDWMLPDGTFNKSLYMNW